MEFYRDISISSSKVGSGGVVNFPVFIDSVLGSGVASASGYDVHFTNSDGSVELDFELTNWDNSTKRWSGWVRLPSISSSVDTTIRVYYGDSSINTDQSSSSVWRSEYRSVFHFNNSLLDSSSNGTVLTNNGSTNTTGKLGYGRNFNGSQNISMPLNLSSSSSVTISYWMNLSSNTGTLILYEHGSNYNSDKPAFVAYLDSGSMDASINANTGYSMRRITAPTASNWHHMVIVHDISSAGTEENRIFINGVEVSYSSPYSSNNTGSFSNKTLNIFSRNGTSFRPTGVLDEFRVYDGAISPQWALTEYNNQNDPSTFYSLGSQQGGSFQATKTQLGSGRVSKVLSAANTSSSRLSKQLDTSQYGVASISSKMLSTDLIEITFVDGTVYSVTQDSLSRIAKDIPLEQTGIARITRIVSVDQPSTGRIQRIFESTIFGLVRIVKSLASTQESLARLVKTLELNQVSQSRIQWIFNLTQDSISRISVLGEMPQIARARIVNQLSKTQAGMAAIQLVLSLTQGSAARISKAVSLTTTAKAQIAKELNKTIVGRAWLAFTASIEQPSLSTIQKILEINQSSQSYIGTAYEQIIIGRDEVYTVGQTPVQDFIPTDIESDNTYGIGVVQTDSYREIVIDNNNTYEVVERDGI